jgi:hypothetical protein
MSESKKNIYERLEIVQDVDGNVLEQKTFQIRTTAKESNYIKLYLDTMASFNGIRDIPTDVLIAFSNYVTYTNEENSPSQIVLVKTVKEQIASALGIRMSMVDKYIKRMVEAGVIFRTECRGVFTVNPWLIAKGEWSKICALRTEFNFIDGTWSYTKRVKQEPNE